jgi:hypothetical protein
MASRSYVVPTRQPGFTLNDLPTLEILLKITPNGKDAWILGYDAVLHFEDGTKKTITVPAGSITLHQAHQEWDRNS